MITTYFRSSSINNWSYCQLQYFMTYVLGHYSPSGQKADMGTMTHAVFETLAICKKRLQTGKRARMKITHDPIGSFSFSEADLYTDEFVYRVLNRSFDFYKKNCPHNTFDSKSYDFVEKMVWDTLRYNGGRFDPRNRTIVDTEPHFDLLINEPWAKFSFDGPEGPIEGNLAIKGTIDLITELPDRTLEVIDWKGLPVDTPIPTTEGWKTMGSLKIGDLVFDEIGLPTKVIGKSQVKTKSCYRVVFNDKSEVVCDDEHLWAVNNFISKRKVVPVTELKVGDIIPSTGRLDPDYDELLDIRYKPYDGFIRVVASIEKLSYELQTQCIMVDSWLHTYLCTRDLIPTHNTGQRLDWATGERKDYEKLMKDSQLLLYDYAISRVYPKYSHRIMTIFFCRDGGPFSLAYEEEDIQEFINVKLKKLFKEIVNNQNPQPRSPNRSDFRCTKLCHYYKNNWPETDQTMCHYIEDKLHTIGMPETVKQCSRDGFTIGTYKDPGAV